MISAMLEDLLARRPVGTFEVRMIGRAGRTDSARDSLITPVSAIACSTSSLRFCAAARLCVGASRDGAWTMPASIADCARLRCSGSRLK